MTSTRGSRIETAALTAILGCAAVFYLSTLREGHHWGGYFARYILQARNLLEGLPMHHGYIPNPAGGLSNGPPASPAASSAPDSGPL